MTATLDAPAQRSWRGFVGVLCAQATAWTGTRLSALAVPWFVLTTTGSATRVGLVVFAQLTPFVVVQALAGPLIDRIGPRRVSLTCDLVAAAAVAGVPLLYAMGQLHLGALLALMAVVGAAEGPSNAAKAVFIPEITAAARVPLERGTGLASSIERLSSTIGPAVAGLVVAAFGGVSALWVTAVLFAASAAIIGWAAPRREPAGADGPAQGYLAQLRDGASYLGKERLLRSIYGMVAVTNLLDAAWVSVLLPVWAYRGGYGPATVGMSIGVISGFAVVAALLAAAIGHRLPRRTVYLVGFLIAGAPRFAVLAFGAPLWLIVGVYAVSGFCGGVLNPILGAVMYERVPRELLGRVRTLGTAVAWSGMPFGGLVGGGMIALFGLTPALLVFGGLYLVTTMLPGLQREWAEMDRGDSHP